MTKETIFYNLDDLVHNKALLSFVQEDGKWQVVPYETAVFSGKMLCLGECVHADEISLKLNQKGWHKIYLGFIGISYQTRTAIRFGKYGKTVFDLPLVDTWDIQGQITEVFTRALDLEGVDLTLSKPEGCAPLSSGLAYIRLEKMTKEEIAEYNKTAGGSVHYHFDQDYLGETHYKSIEDYLGRLGMIENSGGGILFHETSCDGTFFSTGDVNLPYMSLIQRRNALIKKYHENRKAIKTLLLKTAREKGYEVYATRRICLGDFYIPLTTQYLIHGALNGNEDLQIETRDGRTVQALSYAYPKAREMAIRSIIDSMDGLSYDGVSLAFHRGVFLGFEQPVRERVWTLYGVDARVLPASDERLHGVWCEYLTTFMRELREKLDETFGKNKLKINAIVFFDPVSSKNFGFDVETWAKEGLVNNVSQGMMKWQEDLTNCLDGNGLINLEKYVFERGNREILQRVYTDRDTDLTVNGAKAFLDLLNPYDVDFYAALPWDNAPEHWFYKIASELKTIGVKNLFSWNTNHKARKPAVINAEKEISRNFASGKFGLKKAKVYRVLSCGGKNIADWNVNWNG